MPSRSGSSPTAISSSRTAASARGRSIAGMLVRGSWLIRSTATSVAIARTDGGTAVDVASTTWRGQDHRTLGLVRGVTVRGGLGPRPRRDVRRLAGRGPGPGRPSRAATQRPEDLRDLRLVERLPVEEGRDEVVEHVTVLDQDVERLLVSVREQLLGLLVHDRRDVLGVVAGVPEVPAQERLRVVVAELDGAEALGHAVLGDHRPGHRGRLVDVVAGSGGRVVEDHLLGRPTAEHVRQLVEELRSG